jgi:nitrogen fixation NifU-like protein
VLSPVYLDHCAHPRGGGDLPDADGAARRENPACGDEARVEVRLREGRVDAVGWRAEGCAASLACLSMLVEAVAGRPVEEARVLDAGGLAARLGGLPQGKSHAAVLAIEAFRAALAAAEERR